MKNGKNHHFYHALIAKINTVIQNYSADIGNRIFYFRYSVELHVNKASTMKRIWIWAFILMGFNLSAQNHQMIIDSLLARVDTMDVRNKAMAHIEIAIQYQFIHGGFEQLEVHAEKALKISEEHDLHGGKLMAYYYLAMAASQGREDFEAAKMYYEKIKETLIELKNFKKIPDIDNAIGANEINRGNYEEALLALQEAYDGALKYEDYGTLSRISTNLGIVYNNTNDTLNAIKINEKALEFLSKQKSHQNDVSRVAVFLNLSDLYRRTDQLKKTEEILTKTRKLVDSLKIFRLDARLILAEAQLLDAQDKKQQLYDLVDQKLHLFESNTGYDRKTYTSLLFFKGRQAAENGDVKTVKKVIQTFKDHLEGTNIGHQNNLLQAIYDLSERIGEYKDAFIYLDRYKVLNDSLLNAKQKEKILALERRYQLEQKDRQIEQNTIENLQLKKDNGVLLAGLLGFLILALLAYIWYHRKRQKEAEKINQIEQKMLSLQMNPHFIFNAISSIQNFLFDEGDSKKAIHHLSTFASLMRQILENSRERFIPLEEEIEFLRNYLNLQKLRFDNQFDYEINIAEDIDPETISIPPLLTQPFVENAIDHGKIYMVNKGMVKINIKKDKGDLIIQIVDNGYGLDSKDGDNTKPLVIKKKSLSISITNERLLLLSRLMKKKFFLEVKPNESGKGTIVNLNIPSVSLN